MPPDIAPDAQFQIVALPLRRVGFFHRYLKRMIKPVLLNKPLCNFTRIAIHFTYSNRGSIQGRGTQDLTTGGIPFIRLILPCP